MKRIFAILVLAMLMPATQLFAQVSVDEVAAAEEPVVFENNIKQSDVAVNMESEAKIRAERMMRRKERNTVDFTANLHGSLTAFSKSWQAAGDNTITVLANLNFLHTYKQGRFTLTNTASAKFGYNNTKIDLNGEQRGVWFKNVDEIALSTSPQWALVKNWSYGANVKFRTQFAPGYEARGDKQLGNQRVSNFMAPGYLDASLGFTYILPSEKFPLKVNLAPIALSATYRQDLGTSKDYGVAPPLRQKYEGGLSVQLDFDKTWGKNGWLRYRTTAYSFYGWITGISTNKFSQTVPTLRWENTFDIKATKYISTQIYVQLYYNKAEYHKLQLQSMLSVGLTYTFKNK
ncbi:MAG: DUF3078 domain-containing protein [Alistipes sp.]|nr:DUF3078 domain-containing protein [Alistipes sp.]